MKLIVLACCLLFFSLSIVSAQWEWLAPYPQGNDLHDIFFLDENFGWSVGQSSSLIRTTDGGKTWSLETVKSADSYLNLSSILFITTNRGWVISGDGECFQSWNGGETWYPEDIPHDFKVRNISFSDTKHGWMIGDRGEMLFTTDSGEEWSSAVSGTTVRIHGIYALDSSRIWVVGDSATILHSPNGGRSWIKQYSHPSRGDFKTVILRQIHFVDKEYGWAVGTREQLGYKLSGVVYRTTNGGIDWEEVFEEKVGDFIADFKDAHFINRDTGWIVGDRMAIEKTIDGGLTWKRIHYEPIGPILRHISGEISYNAISYDGANIWFAGDLGIIQNMPLKDSILQPISSHVPSNDTTLSFLSVHFSDADTGLILGLRPGRTNLLRTTNSGRHWEEIMPIGDSTSYPIDFCTMGASSIWVVGYSGLVAKSTNAGREWIRLDADTGGNSYYSVHFSDSLTGSILADIGNGQTMLLRTGNGGIDWDSVSSFQTRRRKIYFKDSWHGWSIGSEPALLVTHDGGVRWDTLEFNADSISNATLTDIAFADERNGWIVGEQGLMLMTTDGGEHWNRQPRLDPYGRDYNAIEFSNPSQGWIVGDFGTVIVTTNGGRTWQKQEINTRYHLYDLHFLDSYRGKIVGQNGTILKTSNGGGTASLLEEELTDIDLRLSIYPNPTHGEIYFTYSLPVAENIRIQLTDYTGRQIQTLVDTEQSVGGHELMFNAEHLSMGLYYVVLTTESQTIARPFLLSVQ